MKKFLALYMGTQEGFEKYKAMDAEMRKNNDMKGMEAWGAWVAAHKDVIADMGSPIGKTKRVDKSGVSDTRNGIGAYTVVEAESLEAAAQMFLNHPHFTVFSGESVEVMECLPMPGMPQ